MYEMIITPSQPVLHQVSNGSSALLSGGEVEDIPMAEGSVYMEGVNRFGCSICRVESPDPLHIPYTGAKVTCIEHCPTPTFKEKPWKKK